ncbi:hypothetical protein BDU57DRAFT_547611 [Ampelomyces quisqualis]|uniref:Uncharacterized protein n=1 Tax=Ampelomyces quisqualis TaxID=50730 RepID=A0A6A5QLH0_AMPQU|nr:hypothetical protein BDU57DRAFT_547611 [Ampelomyces quisqualis]
MMRLPIQRLFCTTVAFLFLFFRLGSAQRPNSASVCDYYAQAQFGANTSATQLKWIQSVVTLAFEGGSTLSNVTSELTGILRPGSINDVAIDLREYFNRSRASTNVRNAPVSINWLDQGSTIPLADFLSSKTETLVLSNTSNQYHLFGNFFTAFGRSFGCTLPPPPLSNTDGPVSLAYAHKFMNLEYNQLAYFIKQLAIASTHFRVSPQYRVKRSMSV